MELWEGGFGVREMHVGSEGDTGCKEFRRVGDGLDLVVEAVHGVSQWKNVDGWMERGRERRNRGLFAMRLNE